MSMSEIRKNFQKNLRQGVDEEAIQLAHIKRVRESLIKKHKYRNVPQTGNKGDRVANGR